jgi:hypothetical protein
MAHYAFLDEDNIVTEVITGVDEDVVQTDTDGTQVGGTSEAWETFYGNFRGQVCKRTSYNNNYRKNYAGIGYVYDAAREAFIAPKPYASWILDEDTCQWQAPTPYPTDGKNYYWSEDDLAWTETTDE